MRDLERLLKDSLQEIGGGYEPSDPVAAKQRFLAARRRRRFYAAGEFALAGCLTVVAFLAITRAGIGTDDHVRIVTAAAPRIVEEIQEGGMPVAVAAGEGAVWISNGSEIRKLDPETGERSADAASLSGDADEVITGDGHVWASDTSGNIYKIAPSTARVIETFSVDTSASEPVRLDLAVDGGQVWAAEPQSGTVHTFDADGTPSVNEYEQQITDVAAGETDGVWGYSPEGSLVPVFPDTGAILPAPAGDANSDLAVGFGAAWVATGGDGGIHRVDLASGEWTNSSDIGGRYSDLTIDVSERHVWAVAIDPERDTSTLYELDPLTGEVLSDPLKLDGVAADVSADDGFLWVPDRDGKVTKVATQDPVDGEISEPLDPTEETLNSNEIVMVFERADDIWVRTPTLEKNITNSDELEGDPTVSPDGRYIAFERQTGKVGEPEVVVYDTVVEQECCVRPGSEPALGPYNQLAWALPPPVGVTSPIQEIAFATVGREETLSFSAADASVLPGFSVTDIAWDQVGSAILIEGGYEGIDVFRATLQTEPTGDAPDARRVVRMDTAEIVLPDDYQQGGGYLAPSSSFDFSIVHTCCATVEGQRPTEFEFGTLTPDPKGQERSFRPLADLSAAGFDGSSGSTWSAMVGEVWIEETEDGFEFVSSDATAFAIGDGARVWLVQFPSGDIVELPMDDVVDASAPNAFHALQDAGD